MSDPSNHPQSGGIAFGGGTGNDFVREFEEARDAALESGNTDGMIREEILSIRPHGTEAKSEEFVLPDFDPDVKPDEPQPTGEDMEIFDPQNIWKHKTVTNYYAKNLRVPFSPRSV